MAAASGPCRLLALSDDEVSMVAHELCDPLRPLLAVNLSSTAKGLRAAMCAARRHAVHVTRQMPLAPSCV